MSSFRFWIISVILVLAGLATLENADETLDSPIRNPPKCRREHAGYSTGPDFTGLLDPRAILASYLLLAIGLVMVGSASVAVAESAWCQLLVLPGHVTPSL